MNCLTTRHGYSRGIKICHLVALVRISIKWMSRYEVRLLYKCRLVSLKCWDFAPTGKKCCKNCWNEITGRNHLTCKISDFCEIEIMVEEEWNRTGWKGENKIRREWKWKSCSGHDVNWTMSHLAWDRVTLFEWEECHVSWLVMRSSRIRKKNVQ